MLKHYGGQTIIAAVRRAGMGRAAAQTGRCLKFRTPRTVDSLLVLAEHRRERCSRHSGTAEFEAVARVGTGLGHTLRSTL